MIEEISACDERLVKVSGAAGTGKTEALIARAARLINGGADPSTILMVASTTFGAQALRERLRAALGEDNAPAANEVAITTALNAAVAVLGTPAAREATGRKPRLLAGFEHNFFIEDMKTTGQSRRQLKNVMDLFDRHWCSYDTSEDWLIPGEQTVAWQRAQEALGALGAMLPNEAPYLAARFLQENPKGRAQCGFEVVLADDFQNLSHAQQTLVCLLANRQVMVAGNGNETATCASPLPHPDGFTQFENLRNGVTCFQLETAFNNVKATAFADALAVAGADSQALTAQKRDGSATDITLVKWNMAEDEFNSLTKYLRALIADREIEESQMCVVVPNKRWARTMQQALGKRGIKTSADGAFPSLVGDPRDAARSQALIAFTKLNLLANPEDVVAWRAWCGYGHQLTHSDTWGRLLEYARQQGIPVLEALPAVAQAVAGGTEPFMKAKLIAERYNQGREFIEKNSRRKGFGLTRAAGLDGLREFKGTLDTLAGDEDAATVYAVLRDKEMNPTFTEGAHILRISSYENMVGCNYQYVVITGCVDGLMPVRDAFEVVSTDEDRKRVMDAERRLFAGAVAKAGQELMLSTFSRAQLELAEKTKMQVTRVRSDGDDRIALLRPTTFIAEARNATPSTIGGQMLLSKYDLA
ncbi:UvrD-helicase domain-containing protein [Parvibacter caecicola]|uniref:DNA helicase-2/ATP-dependent DNA helicase PcrA n=1 Tax=Parvibacter caecicola TaxID=747645 RepID=A0A7W5D3Q3_9ACTN|nr:UvrD-helicase domain-containing protein [Parvibacter caecicola]MBB3172093.1 DNA helicase-2/ATP-dependent DNA helicase PcrA [Parvibacter caecicola]MCR2041027.1 UvrD-helicase domain-containing protein [Parvibacter caecicola]RNL10233.1 hypothetical protein DMP11_07620 [Parvibacter caecicola]